MVVRRSARPTALVRRLASLFNTLRECLRRDRETKLVDSENLRDPVADGKVAKRVDVHARDSRAVRFYDGSIDTGKVECVRRDAISGGGFARPDADVSDLGIGVRTPRHDECVNLYVDADIPGGKDAPIGRSKMAIDFDPALVGHDSRRLEAEFVEVGFPTGRHEERVSLNAATGAENEKGP